MELADEAGGVQLDQQLEQLVELWRPELLFEFGLGAISIEFLVDADDSGGSVPVFECVVPPDANVPVPHSHDAFEETIYGLEGVCAWTIDASPPLSSR